MILQNLAKAVRKKKYYAVVLEFLIVIAGVVIGFQIHGWDESWQERLREAEYLHQLKGELTIVQNRSLRSKLASVP